MFPQKRAEWVFDALPPSGARRGGNPAEHAFKHDLSTFVREVVQNANDQAQARPRVVFRLCRFEGDALARFLEALDFASLRAHLEAGASTKSGVGLRRELEALTKRRALHVMYVEDHGTEGLTGDEAEGESHFRALCKDTLFSHKREESAGGSYGLGKSVLWIFSGLSTVLFDSTLMQCPDDRVNPRFIGRVELPSHSVSSGARKGDYAGSGWLGERKALERGVRAESVWGVDARAHASALGFRDRKDHEIGTSIAIVGFRDPTEDEEPSHERLVDRTRRAIVVNFWPAMLLPRRRLRAEVGFGDDLEVVSIDGTEAAPFLEAWMGRTAARERLEQPGDVVVRPIPFRVPAREDGGAPVEGTVDLIVRLESERHPRARVGEIAVFRGPGMVVKYWDRSRIALGMRPFHGVLACGIARDPLRPTPEDEAIEAFLRLAEPPSHDDFLSTQRLKETYRPGYKKALDDLKLCVDDVLRSLLFVAPDSGKKGPERLQRRFPIGKKGATDKRASAFRIHRLSATLGEDGWRFQGTVEPVVAGHAWHAEVRLAEVDERGERTDAIAVQSFDVDASAAVRIEDGAAIVEAGADLRRLAFRGHSAPSPYMGALEVEISGRIDASAQK